MMWDAGGLPTEPSSAHTSFERRYRLAAHLDAAHNLANWILRDRADAEDAVQQAYVRALGSFQTLRGDDDRRWLLSIVRNCCYDRIKHRVRDVLSDDAAEFISDERPNPEVSLLNKEATQTLSEAVQALAPHLREVLVLREFENMSYKEIAGVTGVPVGTVMSRLSRARLRLIAVVRLANRRGA